MTEQDDNFWKLKKEVKMTLNLKSEGWAYDSISFPIIAGWHQSTQIDRYIFKNIKREVEWAKKAGFKYINLNEVISICKELLEPKKYYIKKDLLSEKNSIKNTFIKTYLMKDNHNNLYKIGFSKNPKKRERTLQSEKPSIKIVKLWDYNIERKLHEKYDEFRVRGEWFNLTPIQVRYICTHY